MMSTTVMSMAFPSFMLPEMPTVPPLMSSLVVILVTLLGNASLQ